MAWEECVAYIQKCYAPKPVMEIDKVNWAQQSQDALNGDCYSTGQPFFLVCQGRHCDDNVNITPQAHALCTCRDMNNNQIEGCTPPTALYPFPGHVCLNTSAPTVVNDNSKKRGRYCTNLGPTYYDLTCFCCCSCFAYGTRIMTPNGTRAIEDFAIGDKVQTAAIGAGPVQKLNCSTAKVAFGFGTGPDSHQSAMVHIRHAGVGSLIVTPDHLFLLSTGKLKRADRLVPGKDFFVSSEGAAVPINEVSLGAYDGGVHHITTGNDFTGSIDNHLLLSEGVVSGDFLLQMHATDLIGSGIIDAHEALPRIGSPAYEATHKHLASDQYGARWATKESLAARATAPAAVRAGQDHPNVHKFYVFNPQGTSIPHDAATYFSPLQEKDLTANADRTDFAEAGIGAAMVQYAVRLFQGFYPDIVFAYDAGQVRPNAFAFVSFGRQFVVLSGGLTRVRGLGLEGLSLILAHMITRLQKSPPLGANGFTSVAMADYYSTVVLRMVYFGSAYASTFKQGLTQIDKALFKKITEHPAYETDPYAPTIDTRTDALNAGDGMDFPPAGIGGPEQGGLKVTEASAQPPCVTADTLIGADIDATAAANAYSALVANNVLDGTGAIAADFGIGSNLSFLFADQPDDRKRYLTETVRGVLLHALATAKIDFNVPVDPRTASDPDDYDFEPTLAVQSVQFSTDGLTALLAVPMQRDTDYTITVRSIVRAVGGSTLSPDDNSKKIRIG